MSNIEIPSEYIPCVRTALTAAGAIGPVGVFGNIDAVAVGAVWTKMFIDIKKRSNYTLGSDPKRICGGIVVGIAGYYTGSKIASWFCFLIPGAGIFIGMGISSIVNVYFTYRLALILIELMNKPNIKDDSSIIEYIVAFLKKTPSKKEVQNIIAIYKTWN